MTPEEARKIADQNKLLDTKGMSAPAAEKARAAYEDQKRKKAASQLPE